jgi:hypothetical protein
MRMFCDVRQRLLGDAVEHQFDFGGQAPAETAGLIVDGDLPLVGESLRELAEGGGQSEIVKRRRSKFERLTSYTF